jgi:4'-phosphopantetheinyl transferase
VHVWLCFEPLVASSELKAAAFALMSSDERNRYRCFVFERDRRRYLLARMLVRHALARYVARIPSCLTFGANPYGRPFLTEQPASEHGPVSFNLTHTAGLIALAVTRGRAIGIDAECAQRTLAIPSKSTVFSPAEISTVAASPLESRHRTLLELWTLKESYIKARGRGLSLPLHDISFAFPAVEEVAIEFAEGFDDAPKRWDLWQLQPRSGHLVALCVESRSIPSRPLTAYEFVPLGTSKVIDLPAFRSTRRKAAE